MLEEVEEEGRLCLKKVEEVGVLHGMEAHGRRGSLAAGLGWEVGGQSGLAEVEESEQSVRGLGQAAEDPACWVEVVEVQLLCSPPFSPPPSLQIAR